MRAAAVPSASRSAAGIAFSAALTSSGFNSSEATRDALSRSKSAVYSSTAVSPRARTSAMIADTEVSIASSCAVSKAMSRASAKSKSEALESNLRTAGVLAIRALLHGTGDRFDQRLHAVTLELQRGRVDDQARADRCDVFDGDEIICLERIAAAHQIDDRFSEPHQRRKLHRPVQSDQINVHALFGEMLARSRHILGRHAQARATLDRA